MVELYIWGIVIVALVFDFLNGMNDAANAVATVVSTKVLRPWQAVLWSAFFNFAAAFGFGTAVAFTIGKGIVDPDVVEPMMVLGALMGAIIWTYAATHFGIPISVSHALIGGLLGAAIVFAGIDSVIIGQKIYLTLTFIALSPLLGMGIAFFFMLFVLRLASKSSPHTVDKYFRRLQLISAGAFSYGHGSNDAQKTMGIILVLLFSAGYFGGQTAEQIQVPPWLLIACYGAISFGTLAGGYKVIKTMGMRLTELKPVHGFCAETSGAATIIGCSLIGIPVSTTHTITGTIFGVGSTRGARAVRWGIARNIMWAWILTIPAAAGVGAASMFLLLVLGLA